MSIVSWRDMPFRTVVRQQFDFSCGSAAFATLLTYHYGRLESEEGVFKAMYDAGDQAKIKALGFSLLDMKRYAESRGYKADGYRLTLDQLARAQRPAIVMIKLGPYSHFVVIKGIRDGKVLVGDPSRGLTSYTQESFRSVWNGVAFMIEDTRGAMPIFDRDQEWRARPAPPMDQPLGHASLATFTRDLPPIYQITPPVPSIASSQ
ncbi:MAG: C39 family peptidase [Caulobacter sp.]